MKRIFISLLAVLVTSAAYGQFYVGGNIGATFTSDQYDMSLAGRYSKAFSVMPEIGYSFNDYLSAGLVLGYWWNELGLNSQLGASPYLRGTYMLCDHFGLFLDVLFDYRYYIRQKYSLSKFGLSPGVKVPVTDRCGFVARFAFVGEQLFNGRKTFLANVDFLNSSTVGFYVLLGKK